MAPDSEPEHDNYRNFKKFLMSMPLSEDADYPDLIDVDVLRSTPKPHYLKSLWAFHSSLKKAIDTSFYNGFAKTFTKELIRKFMLMGDKLFSELRELDFSSDRDCIVDGFLIKKINDKATSTSTISDLDTVKIRTSPRVSRKEKKKKRRKKEHHNQDHRKSDLVILESDEVKEVYIPRCVVECKSKSTPAYLREAMAQTLSYGLSVRHHCRLTNEFFVLILSPFTWLSLVLPHYDENTTTGPFVFNAYEVFINKEKRTANGEKKMKKYLRRSEFLTFLYQFRIASNV